MKKFMINGDLNMSKTLYIHCDGGFGNRFNSLVVGLLIVKIGNYHPVVLWPSTNWCRSKFDMIFNFKIDVIEESLLFFSKDFQKYEFVMHNNFLNFSKSVTHPNNFSNIFSLIDFINNLKSNKIVYNNDSIPSYAYCNELYSIINDIKFCNFIVDNSEKFINENNLGNNFYGVHLRNTDFYDPHKPNFDQIYSHIVENSDKKYFVCSDDKQLEEKFNQLDNVFVYPKTNYVEKLTDEGDWRSVIVDDTGVEYPFNVERSDESVQQAMIDLYILSKSDIMKTSNSSFLQTAILLKNSFDA